MIVLGIRHVIDLESVPLEVEQFFLEFLNVENTSDLGLFIVLKDNLKSFDLNFSYDRCYGYDIGQIWKETQRCSKTVV